MPKTYSIVGLNHTKKEDLVAALNGGEDVVLVREPDNPFDPLAIAVWIGGERAGYIPKKQNQTLAQFIDQQGEPFVSDLMALDGKTPQSWEKSLPAKFVWSPNSHFPCVEV